MPFLGFWAKRGYFGADSMGSVWAVWRDVRSRCGFHERGSGNRGSVLRPFWAVLPVCRFGLSLVAPERCIGVYLGPLADSGMSRDSGSAEKARFTFALFLRSGEKGFRIWTVIWRLEGLFRVKIVRHFLRGNVGGHYFVHVAIDSVWFLARFWLALAVSI